MDETNQSNKVSLFWVWERAIPPAVCEQLIREVGEMNLTDGVIGYNVEDQVNKEVRNNKTVFLPNNHWFEGVLLNHARWANKSANWGFHVDDCETLQIASYKAGEKYEWHTDDDLLSRAKPHQRKLTVVCQLSDASSFTGGGLYLKGVEEDSVIKNQGDLIVFPSFLEHKAETVESGHRLTVVCWLIGRHFT
jgi:predicted 2-oxoglutarate/Fe(II)-dependent dioxygenase YbiX